MHSHLAIVTNYPGILFSLENKLWSHRVAYPHCDPQDTIEWYIYTVTLRLPWPDTAKDSRECGPTQKSQTY